MHRRLATRAGLLLALAAGACTDVESDRPVGPARTSIFTGPVREVVLSSNDPAAIAAWLNEITGPCDAVRAVIEAGSYNMPGNAGLWSPGSYCGGVTRRIEVVGRGAGVTNLYFPAVAPDGRPYDGFQVFPGMHVTFDSLALYGGGVASGNTDGGNGIEFIDLDGGEVRNSWLIGWGTSGVKARDSRNITIENNTIACARNGVRPALSMGVFIGVMKSASFSGQSAVRNNTITDCSDEAIDVEGVSDVTIESNTMSCDRTRGWECGWGVALRGRLLRQASGSCLIAPVERATVRYNNVHRTMFGIVMQGNAPSRNNTVFQNGVYDVRYHAVQSSADRDSVVVNGAVVTCSNYPGPQKNVYTFHTGNVFHNNTIARPGRAGAGLGAGVWVGGNSSKIWGNTVDSASQHGVVISSSYNELLSNVSRHSTQTGIYVSGSYNTIGSQGSYTNANEASYSQFYGMRVRSSAGNQVGPTVYTGNRPANFQYF